MSNPGRKGNSTTNTKGRTVGSKDFDTGRGVGRLDPGIKVHPYGGQDGVPLLKISNTRMGTSFPMCKQRLGSDGTVFPLSLGPSRLCLGPL